MKFTAGDACRDMLVKLISFFHPATYPRSTVFAEYSLHPVRQKMVTFNHQVGHDQERVTSEMKATVEKEVSTA